MLTFPTLPHTRQALDLKEHRLLQVWFFELADDLRELEEHLATCPACSSDPAAWQRRAEVLERLAQTAERVEDLQAELGLEEN